jgi:hypothetical protein
MKSFIFNILLFTSVFVNAQTSYYSSPLKIPMLLSGSFAELRSNHFHSGIDIKTQGVTGLPVYAVADGYISRISVSPTGYGNCLYINHPNGTTTVYGHLSKFNADVVKYVKDKQYEQKSFRVNLMIPPGLFPVKKGQEIAKSGNSGSSGGPHLHFEIRNTQTEETTNPLDYHLLIKDTIAPKIFSVLIVPLDDNSHVNYKATAQSFPVVFYDGKYHLKNNPKIPVWGKIGVAIQDNDYLNGSYNKCGINKLVMSVNNEEQFSFKLDKFAFSDTKYINSHIVYGEYIKNKRRYVKTWLQSGNHLPIYTCRKSKGVITPLQNQAQSIDIKISDSYKNTSEISFQIIGDEKMMSKPDNNYIFFPYNQDNSFSNNDVSITIPNGALYEDLKFKFDSDTIASDFYSNLYSIHNKVVPLHRPVTIKIKATNLPHELESKAIIVNVNPNTYKFYSIGGSYKNGMVEVQTRYFGDYAISVDTIAPTIIPLSIKNNAITESNRIRFKISDDLSGIDKYEGTIDGKWALFEYDPRKKMITHYFDKNRFELGKRHEFKLTVTDAKKNSSVYECTFWK